MENIKALTLLAAVLSTGVIVSPQFLLAYERNTHEGLTKAALELYERENGDAFSSEDERLIIKGSRDEDDGTRPLLHFFDPINNRGLVVVKEWISSKLWSKSILLQGNYCFLNICRSRIGKGDALFSSPTDYSWERAVYEYSHGDKEHALESLGHILHLIQDSTVPAHVRNDQHLNHQGFGDSDPYEKFSALFGVGDVEASHANVARVSSLESAFDAVARFTNRNFVSKDTLFEKYSLPSLRSLEVRDGFAWDLEFGHGHRVARVESTTDFFGRSRVSDVFLDDPQNSVASDYWRLLSGTAVSHGAGVIDLFMRSVEEERQTHTLLHQNKSFSEVNNFVKTLAFKQNSTAALSSIGAADLIELNDDEFEGYRAAAEIYGIDFPAIARTSPLKADLQPSPANQAAAAASSINGVIGLFIGEVNGSAETEVSAPDSEPPGQSPEIEGALVVTEDNSAANNSNNTNTHNDNDIQGASTSPQDGPPPLFSIIPGFGGGGVSSSASAPAASKPSQPQVNSPANGAHIATTSALFKGTAQELSLLTLSTGTTTATTTVDAGGDWSLELTLPEGEHALSFSIENDRGIASDAATHTLTIDLTAPSPPAASAGVCDNSLAVGLCLSASESISISWDAVDGADSYVVYLGGESHSTTTATSSSISLANGDTGVVTVKAADLAGNESGASNEVAISVFQKPLIINEIAWAGTAASVEDQWIEIRNVSPHEIDLSKVKLKDASGDTLFALSGTISAKGADLLRDYFLIERGNGSALSRTADLDVDFSSLPQEGGEIILVHDIGTDIILDRTPPVSLCSGWCAGGNTKLGTTAFPDGLGEVFGVVSMERKGENTDGVLADSWDSNDTYTFNTDTRDSGNNTVYGTPDKPNSSRLPEFGWYCGNEDVFSDGATYIPPSSLCTYLSGFIQPNAQRYGMIFEGAVGTSTQQNSHFLNKGRKKPETDNLSGVAAGGKLFVAIFEIRDVPVFDDFNNFKSYFLGDAPSPPHSNFRVLNWVMGGDAPPPAGGVGVN